MKRIYALLIVCITLFVLGLLVVACQPVRPVQASGCSAQTIKGSYGVLGQGQIITTTDPIMDPIGPFTLVGPLTFDGAGKFDLTATFNVNGNIARGVEMTGTYTVDANCTGVLLLAAVAPYDIVIVDGGRELYGTVASPGRIYTSISKRID